MSALEQVIKHPHSIAARKSLAAEWRRTGDARAQFIEDQIDDFEGRGAPGEWSQIKRRVLTALKEHETEWAKPLSTMPTIFGFRYELGLVASIGTTAETFAAHGAELVNMAPIVHLTVSPPGNLVDLAATPVLSQIRSLGAVGGPWIDDDAAVAIARSPYVRGLRGLQLSQGQIGSRGLRALAASANVPNILYIDLTGNPCCVEAPAGMRVEIVRERYYLVGPAGYESLREARGIATRGYDPEDVLWPPPEERLAYEP